jgi:N-acyl-D-aspartate/D-glutamate deacylase
VQISHLKAAGIKNWGKMEPTLNLIEKAQSEGLDVTADMYTYPAGSTGLRSLLPEWALEGGVGLAIERLGDSATREKMEEEMKVTGFCSEVEFDQVYISSSPDKREFEGKYIAELADSATKSPYDWIFDTLHETKLNVMMVNFMMSEDNIKMGLQHPAVMIGTDSFGLAVEGPLSKGKPHPRCYGNYPRLLGHYVRDQKTLTLEEAIRKSTGFPAQKLGWTDRGLIKKGQWADIVVFNPDTIKDTSTYQDPHQYPDGISHVIVNGCIVVDDGSHNASRPGKAL